MSDHRDTGDERTGPDDEFPVYNLADDCPDEHEQFITDLLFTIGERGIVNVQHVIDTTVRITY